MNIFTNDDYRRIQAWLKANAIKDSDFAISEDTVPDEDILVITQNMSGVPTNYKIKIKDLLNSSLGKVIINNITANAMKVNNILTVDAANVKLDNEKGTTLQDVLNYFEENKLNRHTDDTFDGNLTIKKDLTIEGHIKSDDGLTTVEENFEATGEITDGDGNMLSDVNAAAKGWILEYQDPSESEPTVREKFVLKNYKGEQKGNTIKIYKDSAITNVYLGTTEDTCNPDTGEPTKHPIHDNNEALCIVYHLENDKYNLVPIPLGAFVREAEFDKYRGLGVTPNGQVFVKLADDEDTTNYLGFNDDGEITAAGLEERILRELGSLASSVAGDNTMWGLYKQHEGTREASTPNDGSRWGEFKKAEEIREQTSDSAHTVFSDNWDEQDNDPEIPQDKDVVEEASYAYNWKTTDTPASDGKIEGNLKDLYQKSLDTQGVLEEIEKKIGEKCLSKQYTSTDVFNMLWGGTTDGWLNASGQTYNSYFIPILPKQTVSWQVNVGTVSSIKIFDYIPKVGDKKDSIKNLSVSPYTNDSDIIEYLYFGWLGADERKITIIKSGLGINKEIEDLDNRIQQVSDNVSIVDSKTETNKASIDVLNNKIGTKSFSKTYNNSDFSGLLWDGSTNGWLSTQFLQKDSIIIKVAPSQSITWNTIVFVRVFGYEPKIGVKTDKLFYVDGKLDYTNTTGSDVWLYFPYDKSATVNLSIEFSPTGIRNDIENLQKEDTLLHKSISDEIERASSEEANINANITSLESNTNTKLTELNLRVGNKRESKILSNTDFANIIWGGETDGWLHSNSNYNAIIIEVYPQQTIDWSASTTSLARVFDYKPEIGKKIKYVDTIDATQTGTKKDYTNTTEQVMYLYMIYNLPINLNLPITIFPTGIFNSLENLETALDGINDKIGEENSTKEYTSEDTSGLLWGGTSDGWLNDADYSITSYIIKLPSGTDLLLTDIVGKIRQKYVFDYNPKVGDKGDRIATFDYISYSNTTDKTLYVLIGFDKEPGVTLTAHISASGIRKEIKEIKESISLKDTTIVCIGDSLTEFRELSGNKFSYPDYIREMTKANVINIGIGGTRLRQRVEPVDNPSSTTEGYAALDMVNLVKACCTGDFSKQEAGAQYLKQYASDDNTAIVARAKAIDWSKVDVVTILGGANDWAGSSSGSYGESGSTNRETTLGAINVIVDTLLSTYPHLKIFFFTTCFRYVNDTSAGKIGWSDDVSYWGKTLKEFAAMTKNEFELNHIPVCDLYNTLGWNKYNYDNYYVRTVDYSHPYKGFYNIARRVVAFLQANRNF